MLAIITDNNGKAIKEIQARRPDLVIVEKREKRCSNFSDFGLRAKEDEKVALKIAKSCKRSQ